MNDKDSLQARADLSGPPQQVIAVGVSAEAFNDFNLTRSQYAMKTQRQALVSSRLDLAR
jgi:hypothetical protein